MTATESARASQEARKRETAGGRDHRAAADSRNETRLQRYLAAALYRETDAPAKPAHEPSENER
jgi:hypothetical protein